MKKGWIKLHRRVQDCAIWTDNEPFDRRSAWIDLLLSCNHNDKEILFDGKKTIVSRGQLLTSVRQLSERWNWSKDRTLRYLRLLEDMGMVTKQSNARRTLLTIIKYEVYQFPQDSNEDTHEDSYEDSRAYTDKDSHEPQTINIKNEKNEKNIKNKYGEYKHVLLTKDQFNKLVSDYGEQETLDAIKFLDEYIEMKGYKAKNHNLALRKWVFDAVKKDKQKNGSQSQPKSNKFGNGMIAARKSSLELAKEIYGID